MGLPVFSPEYEGEAREKRGREERKKKKKIERASFVPPITTFFSLLLPLSFLLVFFIYANRAQNRWKFSSGVGAGSRVKGTTFAFHPAQFSTRRFRINPSPPATAEFTTWLSYLFPPFALNSETFVPLKTKGKNRRPLTVETYRSETRDRGKVLGRERKREREIDCIYNTNEFI